MKQLPLFDIPWWYDLWQGMPECDQQDLSPFRSLRIHFATNDDLKYFERTVKQRITDRTQYIWFPDSTKQNYKHKYYESIAILTPHYPIYIISKGRWDTRLTSKALEKINVQYHIVIEPQEYDQYAAVIDPDKILVLPFSNLGQGSIPARNWVWEHSISIGAKRHWILDDNINGFVRLNHNSRIPLATGNFFRAVEEFSDRYQNIFLSGLNYREFAVARSRKAPITLNTRIYSCILIDNSCCYRWRGRYNEDTDLSLNVLKNGGCTVLFNAFLANKAATMTLKGGNTDELYKEDGRLLMAQSLQEQHPDVVTITEKWGRWQHHVDYRPFAKNKLILKEGIEIKSGIDNYGMELKLLKTT